MENSYGLCAPIKKAVGRALNLKNNQKVENKMIREIVSLNELISGYGLATNQEEIYSVLECAKPKENLHFVGTNVYEWLSRFTILDTDDMKENFIKLDEEGEEVEGSHFEHKFVIVTQNNTYNWSGHSNTDVDFNFLQSEQGDMYAYVRVHIGTDIRGGFTDGILIDLETQSTDAYHSFLDCLNEVGSDGYVIIKGEGYSIQGDITGEWLSIYNHATHEDYEVCESIYEWSEEKFNSSLKELVLELLEQNKERTK